MSPFTPYPKIDPSADAVVTTSPKLINTSKCFSLSLADGTSMDVPLANPWLDADVDLGFALFFFLLLCVFLLVSIVRCSQIVLDPYSAVSLSIYQEEQEA